MKQLALDLGIDRGRSALTQLNADTEKQLVKLMAEALLALIEDDPRREAGAERKDGDE